mgnify:CR=1 FL=1
MIKSFIFCGGYGSRMNKGKPGPLKPLIKINNKSILQHIFNIYSKFGYKDFYLLGGYKLNELIKFLINYTNKEQVELFIVGQPKQMNNSDSESEKHILSFLKQLEKSLPKITIKRIDERFTSKIAFQTMIDSGLKKKQRRNKGLVDEISATIILQSYLYSK